jgi:alpha-galactosidase
VDQCIGDTIGPGGLFKALRTVPVFLEVLEDVEELCPDAWVLNYTNPMSIMCLASAMVSDANVVGLCHSVQGTSHKLARDAGVPYDKLRWSCAGINHLAWFTELSVDGEDIYPILFEKAREGGEVYESDPVRYDMMLHFGYFITESSGHLSEYLPYYRKRKDLIETYCRDGYRGGSSFYADGWPEWRKGCDNDRRAILAGDKEVNLDRSWEYASFIIEAMETNRPFVIYGTMPNEGLIENLPGEGVVEVACLVDRNGVTPTRFGHLPPQCAAICASNMRMYELAAIACVEKSREAAAHALMLDPLTAAVCCPAEIAKMTDELFEAERDFLPGF